MILIVAVSFIAGAGLGALFRVWILVPATLLTLILLSLTHVYAAASSLPALVGWVASVLALQLGYFFGIVMLRAKARLAHAAVERSHPRSSKAA